MRYALLLLVLGLVVVLQPGWANSQCRVDDKLIGKHVVAGLPEGSSAPSTLITRNLYVLSFDLDRQFAGWVSYFFDGSETDGSGGDNFRDDPCLTRTDHFGSAEYGNDRGLYDKGHLVPDGDFDGSEHRDELWFYSNAVPQEAYFNRYGAWREMEGEVREQVAEHGPFHVMTGPMYKEPMEPFPEAPGFAIPSHYWKIVVVGSENDPATLELWAFIFEQKSCQGTGECVQETHCDGVTTVRKVESETGLNLFPDLAQSVSEEIETKAATWPSCTESY